MRESPNPKLGRRIYQLQDDGEGEEKDEIETRVAGMTNDELRQNIRGLENEIRIMKSNLRSDSIS